MAVPPADSPLWTEVKRALASAPGLLLLPVAPSPFDRLLTKAVRRRDELAPVAVKRVPR